MESTIVALLNSPRVGDTRHEQPDDDPAIVSYASPNSSHAVARKANIGNLFQAEFWSQLWDAAHEDVSQVPWKKVLGQFAGHALSLGAVLLTCVSVLLVGLGILVDTTKVCGPNSRFYPATSGYNRWSMANVFQITVHFGALPFTTAKILDVVWDVLVGRVGQIFIAFISYRVAFQALLHIMETESVSYGTFQATSLQSDSWWGLLALMGEFKTLCSARARVLVVWIVLSSIFVVSFPTLLSAMTGYSANVAPFVHVDGNYAPYSAFSQVRFIIHDGIRVGLSQDYIVNINPFDPDLNTASQLDQCADPTQCPYFSYGAVESQPNWANPSSECLLTWQIAAYVNTWSATIHNQSSTFNNSGTIFNLTAPTLNISTPYVASQWGGNCSIFSDSDPSSSVWSYPTQGSISTFDVAYFNAHGVCQQTESYNWGFSFLLLFVLLVLLAVWSIGHYAVAMHTYLHSRSPPLRRQHTYRYRAILDLASAMRTELGREATATLPESQLRRRIHRTLDGGHIAYPLADEIDVRPSRMQRWRVSWRAFSFRRWLWAEKWWMLYFVVQSIFLGVTLLAAYGAAWWFQTVIALIVGPYSRFSRSRWLAVIPFPLTVPLLWWLGRKRKRYGEYNLT